ncbi:MAG: transcriptional regulator [Frankiales bacterium]|nr:transcriptional regulator [Frankiales bacterium]
MTGVQPAPSTQDVALARHFVRLADTLDADDDDVDLPRQLVATCVEVLGTSAVGVLLMDPQGAVSLVAASSRDVRRLELIEVQSEQGPCRDCVGTGDAVTVDELADVAERWPQFAPAAASLGFRSLHAIPLRLRHEVIGSLNLFRRGAGALTLAEEQIARALADVATIGVLQQRGARSSSVLADQLQNALTSRVVVEQAKGVLKASSALDMDSAFQALRRYARTHHLGLTEVARDLVSARLPTADVLAGRRLRPEDRDPPGP